MPGRTSMRTRSITTLVLAIAPFLLASAKGAAQTYPTVSVATYPAAPAPGEPLTVKLSGIWNDGCVPETSAKVTVARSGTIFLVDLSYAGFSGACTAALTPWALNIFFEPLNEGTYTVEVARSDAIASRTIGSGTFTVAPPATTLFWVPGFSAVGALGALQSTLGATNPTATAAVVTPLAAYDGAGERLHPFPPVTIAPGATSAIDTRALPPGQAVQMLLFSAPSRVVFHPTLEWLQDVGGSPVIPASYGRVETPLFTDLFPAGMTTFAGDLVFTPYECTPSARRRVNLTVFNAGQSAATVQVTAVSPAGAVPGFALTYSVPARSLVQFNALPTDALPVCQSGGYWAGVFLKITVDRPYLAYVSTVRPETFPEILPFEIFAARFER